MKSKLIFLDIDGTLTVPGGFEPPESAARAVRRARELGHKVFLSSGRNYSTIEPLLRYGFDGGAASCGGYVFAGDKVLLDCPFTERQRSGLLRLLHENGVLLSLEARDATYCDEGALEIHGKNRHLLDMIRAVWKDLGPEPMSDYDGRPVYKIVLVAPDGDSIAPAAAELGDELTFIVHDFSEPDCVFGEIIRRDTDKGSAVHLVAEALGYEKQDIIAFGDSMLDLEMIKAAGIGVCMDNGSPKLKELSDLVCPAVGDDGLEKGFRMLGLTD